MKAVMQVVIIVAVITVWALVCIHFGWNFEG